MELNVDLAQKTRMRSVIQLCQVFILLYVFCVNMQLIPRQITSDCVLLKLQQRKSTVLVTRLTVTPSTKISAYPKRMSEIQRK